MQWEISIQLVRNMIIDTELQLCFNLLCESTKTGIPTDINFDAKDRNGSIKVTDLLTKSNRKIIDTTY